MSATSIDGAKPIHPTMPSPKPYHKSKSYGTWGGQAIFKNFEFINFYEKTKLGKQQTVICLNPTASDYIQPHLFIGTKMNNVKPGAMAYLKAPNPGWANLKDCVEFPCTAPLNVLFDFKDTKYNIGSLSNYGPRF
jgi:hypothetical protein